MQSFSHFLATQKLTCLIIDKHTTETYLELRKRLEEYLSSSVELISVALRLLRGISNLLYVV